MKPTKTIFSFKQGFQFISSLLLVSLVTGCGHSYHLYQAGMGQLSLINRAKPIDEVIKNPRTRPSVRILLEEVERLKAFESDFGLNTRSNYRDYVALDQDAVVFVIAASDPLAFKPKTWHYPIVGSFTYTSWFDRKDAEKDAEALRSEGLDVYVRGARAYSTLGWFSDPVLSSMLPQDPKEIGDLVNVLIHETVHATLYIDGQSSFNESVASFIADHLSVEYLSKRFGPKSEELKRYQEGLVQEARFRQFLTERYQELNSVYESKVTDAVKQRKKSSVMSAIEKRFPKSGTWNNARLIQFKTYQSETEEFEILLNTCAGDLKRTFSVLRRLREDSFPEPQMETFGPKVLQPLTRRGCV